MAFFKGYAVGRRRYDGELGGFIKASNLEWGRKLERSTRGPSGEGCCSPERQSGALSTRRFDGRAPAATLLGESRWQAARARARLELVTTSRRLRLRPQPRGDRKGVAMGTSPLDLDRFRQMLEYLNDGAYLTDRTRGVLL